MSIVECNDPLNKHFTELNEKESERKIIMENLSVKINANVAGYEVHCIKCRHPKEFGKCLTSGDNSVFYSSFDNVVIKDYVCEECGCNTFDVDVCIKVECE